MKKSLILMAMASVALASCVNDVADVAQKEQQKVKVGFSAPVLYNNADSRAVHYGEINHDNKVGNDTYSYPTSESFVVYAILHDEPFTTWADMEPFGFNGKAVSYDPDFKSWVPKDDSGDYYYWPNGYLSFAATSPADLECNGANRTYDETGLKITGFQVSSDLEKQYDLLFSEPVKDCTSNSMQAEGSGKFNGVPIKFYHALSSVHFALQNTAANTVVSLQKLEIRGVENTGTFKENIKDESAEYAFAPGVVEPAWVIDYNDAQNVSYVVYDSTTPKVVGESGETQSQGGLNFPPQPRHLSIYAQELGCKGYSILPLPQDLEDVVLEVTYTVNGEEVRPAVIELDGYANLNEWTMGTRYTYTLLYSADSHLDDIIRFAPETNDWVDSETIVIRL